MLARCWDPRTQEPSGHLPPRAPTVGACWDTSGGHCAGLAFSTSIPSSSIIVPSKPTQPLGMTPGEWTRRWSRRARTWAEEDGVLSSVPTLLQCTHLPGELREDGATHTCRCPGRGDCDYRSLQLPVELPTPQLSPVAQSPRKPNLSHHSPGQLGGPGSPALRCHDSRSVPGA